jgi:hypothetical protein
VGPTRPRLLGPLYALTSVGSATLPWAVGAISTAVESLRAGLTVAIAGCAVMILFTIVGSRRAVVASGG